MTANTTTDDATEEWTANHADFAYAVQAGGHHDGGALASPPNSAEMHVGTLPGHEDEVDQLAEEYGFKLGRAELTRRVYVPAEDSGDE